MSAPSQDEKRLKALIYMLAAEADANRAALFVPRGTGLALLTDYNVDQMLIDRAEAGWARFRSELRRGGRVRHGQTVLWGICTGPELRMLACFDTALDSFPDDHSRTQAALIGRRLTAADLPSRARAALCAGVPAVESRDEVERDQLAVLLRAWRGNVSEVARELRLSRQTIYRRLERLGLELSDYRRPQRA